jgi:hypothetical protein
VGGDLLLLSDGRKIIGRFGTVIGAQRAAYETVKRLVRGHGLRTWRPADSKMKIRLPVFENS